MRLVPLKLALCLALALLGASASRPASAAQGSACMPSTGTVSGLQFSTDVTVGLAALLSSNSGATAPSNDCTGAPVLGQMWLDTSTTPRALKQYDGSSWLLIGYLDSTNHVYLPALGGGVVSVASAATTDLCANKSTYQTITGTANISSFGSSCASPGQLRVLQFASTVTFTPGASLAMPNGIVTAPGDQALAAYVGGGVWRITHYQRQDGTALVAPVGTLTLPVTGATLPYNVNANDLEADGYISIFHWIPPAQRAAIRNYTSTYDATAAIQAAAATGLKIQFPAGLFNVTNAVTMAVGSKFRGSGATPDTGGTTINISSSGALAFNMSARGVFVINHYIELSGGFLFKFAQPDVTTRASMTQYPPALIGPAPIGGTPSQAYTVNIRDIECAAPWVCMDMRGNINGDWDRILLSCFSQCWLIDGQSEFARAGHVECWVFGMTANQQVAALNNGGFTCLDVGFAAMTFSNFEAFYGNLFFHAGATSYGGLPDVAFGSLALDTSELSVSAGEVQVGSVFGTRDGSAALGTGRMNIFLETNTTGTLNVGTASIVSNSDPGAPIVAAHAGRITIAGGRIGQLSTAAPTAEVDTNGLLVLGSGLLLETAHTAGQVRTAPFISQVGGGVVMNATVDRTYLSSGVIAAFNTDDARNFIEPKRYKGMNGGTPFTATFSLTGTTNGSYN